MKTWYKLGMFLKWGCEKKNTRAFNGGFYLGMGLSASMNSTAGRVLQFRGRFRDQFRSSVAGSAASSAVPQHTNMCIELTKQCSVLWAFFDVLIAFVACSSQVKSGAVICCG